MPEHTNRPLLTETQVSAVNVAYEPFSQTGEWPIHEYVDDQLYRRHRVHLRSVLSDPQLPFGVIRQPYPYSTQERVKITVLGLSYAPAASADVSLFLRALMWLVRKRTEFVPPPNEYRQLGVTADNFRLELYPLSAQPSELELVKVHDMLMGEPLMLGGSPDAVRGVWTIVVPSEIREYEGVYTIEDYIDQQRKLFAPPKQAPDFEVLAAPRPVVSRTVLPSSGRTSPQSSVFVLMPFSESWSDSVYAFMLEACRAAAPFARVYRADDIAKPGRITDQIIEAVRSADVILADLTGENPNVMYELGYAQALEKPLVLLNQFLKPPPFDLADMRQIEYALGNFLASQSGLERALHAAFEMAGIAPEPGP